MVQNPADRPAHRLAGQPARTVKPTRKTTVGTAAAAVTVIVVWLVSMAGVEVPAEVASAFTTLVTAVAVYFTRDRLPAPPQDDPLGPEYN